VIAAKRVAMTCVAVVLLTAVAVLVSGCASPEAPMSGVVVAPGQAALSSHDQLGANESLLVDSVTAPGASWLIAYRVGMEGMPGAMLGYVAVPAGTATEVRIPIDPEIRLTPLAIIVLNADRGIPGKFEFDMDRFEASPDKPYYTAGAAVQATITVALPEDGDTFAVPDAPMLAP